VSIEEIHEKTQIDVFFLQKIKNVIDTRKTIEKNIKKLPDLKKEIDLIKQAKLQ
jgi:hypothetical protein